MKKKKNAPTNNSSRVRGFWQREPAHEYPPDNAFSKKFDSHCYAPALYFFHYNFCRQHKSLRVSPAMAAGITDELPDMTHLCKLMDDANPPKRRGPYKKQT